MAFIPEPANSIEVSYAILCKKPTYKLGITIEQLSTTLGYKRAAELSKWADRFLTYKWFVDHTIYRPYIKPEEGAREFNY